MTHCSSKHHFHRILNGDDVAAEILVQVHHHGGHGGGFTGAGNARQQGEATLGFGELEAMGLMPSFSMGGRSFLMYRMAIAHFPVWEKRSHGIGQTWG